MKKVTIYKDGQQVRWPVVVPDKEAELIAEDWQEAGYEAKVEEVRK